MEGKQQRVLIIGAGIAGLTMAVRLREEGHAVTVLDKADRPGGAIRTLEREGYRVELGPNTVQSTCRETQDFLSRGKLAETLLEPQPEAKNRFLVRGGRVLPVPASPLGGVRSPLFSLRGKLRLAAEVFVPKKRGDADESLADFARRRVGREFLDYALNPMVAGVYAGDPEKLSVRHAFPKVARLETDHGGLIKGAMAVKKAKKQAGDTYKTRLLSYRDGLETLPKTLAAELGKDLHLGATVREVAHEAAAEQPFTVRWDADDGAHTEAYHQLVLALPPRGYPSLGLPEKLAALLQPLQEITVPPLTSMALGYRRADVQHPLDGFGMLIPEKEQRNMLGTLFSSSLFPGRAPEGHVLLTSFIGGMRQPELAGKPHDALQALIEQDLQELLGITGKPTFVEATHWPQSIPQYTVGYQRFFDAMEAAEKAYPGLHLTGNHREGISVEKCILGALARAQRLSASNHERGHSNFIEGLPPAQSKS